VIKRSEAGSD